MRMPDSPTAYPLQWPAGWPRTPYFRRKESRFGIGAADRKPLTITAAISRLQAEIARINARYAVISSNIPASRNGRPLSGQRVPNDPGVALYFQLKGRPTVLPCDRYTTVAANIAAIAAHIEATRAIERHGVGTLDQMFTGFQAIRGPGEKPWREVLGFPADQAVTAADVKAKQRELARRHHPDAGGTEAAMAEINDAADRALREVAGA